MQTRISWWVRNWCHQGWIIRTKRWSLRCGRQTRRPSCWVILNSKFKITNRSSWAGINNNCQTYFSIRTKEYSLFRTLKFCIVSNRISFRRMFPILIYWRIVLNSIWEGLRSCSSLLFNNRRRSHNLLYRSVRRVRFSNRIRRLRRWRRSMNRIIKRRSFWIIS